MINKPDFNKKAQLSLTNLRNASAGVAWFIYEKRGFLYCMQSVRIYRALKRSYAE